MGLRKRAFACWRLLSNQRGAALFAAVVAMLLLSITLASFIALSRSEVLIAQNDREAVQAFFAAEAGANVGRWVLRQRLTTDLSLQVATVPLTSTHLENRYNSPAGAALFLAEFANLAGGTNFVVCPAGECPDPPWDRRPDGTEFPDAQQAVMTLTNVSPAYTTRVVVSAATTPLVSPGGDHALFPYRWRIESTGIAGRARQIVSLSSQALELPDGIFAIALSKGYTRFAHFLNDAQTGSAGTVWFHSGHVYDGPVHTNSRFNISFSPTFKERATQAHGRANFQHAGNDLEADSNPPDDTPKLGLNAVACTQVDCAGFDRSFDYDPTTPAIDPIPLPGSGARSAQRNAALGGTTPTPPANYSVHVGATAVGETTGGIYIQGPAVDFELAANPGGITGQQFLIQTSSMRRTVITVDRVARTTTVSHQCHWNGSLCTGNASDPWTPEPGITAQTLSGLTNGVVFVDSGGIQALHGPTTGAAAVNRDTLLDIIADGTINITHHLRYQADPRGADGVWGGSDDQIGVDNVLGLVSWNGDVVIDTPDGFGPVDLHFIVMTPNLDGGAGGEFRAARQSARPAEGNANLVGGVIQMTFGPFGTFSGASLVHGYATNWSHDQRYLLRGLAPPFFPTLENFVVTTTGLGFNTYTWRQGR